VCSSMIAVMPVRGSGDIVEIQLRLGQLELHQDGIGVAITNHIDACVQEFVSSETTRKWPGATEGLLGSRLRLFLERTYFALSLERRRVLQVQLHEASRERERLVARRRVHDHVAADNLLGLGKGPIH
jgi:hypothetical protein